MSRTFAFVILGGAGKFV